MKSRCVIGPREGWFNVHPLASLAESTDGRNTGPTLDPAGPGTASRSGDPRLRTVSVGEQRRPAATPGILAGLAPSFVGPALVASAVESRENEGEGVHVIPPSICRTRRRGFLRGRAGRTGGCQYAGCVRAPAQPGHDRSGGRANTDDAHWCASAVGASEGVGASTGSPPCGLRRHLTVDAAEERAAVRNARHDAAGEQRHGARSQ